MRLLLRLALPACIGVLAGCGGSAHHSAATSTAARRGAEPIATKVCQAAQRAAAAALGGPVATRTPSTDPAYLECVLTQPLTRVDVIVQAVPGARTHFETQVVHHVQTEVEPGGTKDRSQLPRDVSGVGTEAAWVPGQHLLLSTNGTLYRGGNYVEVTVTGRRRPGPAGEAVARAVTIATLAVAPRGPDPGPPPS